MSLLEIKNYLMQVKIATHTSLCNYFRCDADVLQGMLGHWLKKGCVRKLAGSPKCGSCTQCPTSAIATYEWIN